MGKEMQQMAAQERTIIRVIRAPDLMGERGPNPRSGFSTPCVVR
jgi:hypothetical protein